MVQWLNNVRKALESGIRYSESYTPQYLKEEVFVFTPDGELRRLPKGATVLDFAFDIHTNLGIKCSGAIIDGKAVAQVGVMGPQRMDYRGIASALKVVMSELQEISKKKELTDG